MHSVLNVSFYRFVPLKNLEVLREAIRSRALESQLKGSILLSEEGINGFLAAPEAKLRPYLSWLFSTYPEFKGIQPKESFSVDIPFTRMLVKIKREIITMGRPGISPAYRTGRNLPAHELKRWYDEKKEFVIVDTRNDYEITQGAFNGAVHYDIETFRQFPEKLEKHAKELKDKTVVMYCTGGIRCEKATALAMDLGIKDVYQLEGGILKYFEEVGGAHYHGDCFVFDHRSSVGARLEAKTDREFERKTKDLKLIFDENCPYSLRVLYALQSKSIPFEKVMVSVSSGHVPEVVRQHNPHHEVPILLHGALTLYGSNTILSYLDENYPETRSFMPEKAERRARMRLWLDWIDRSFAPDVASWVQHRRILSPDERRSLEIRLEKHLYRLKTPLQRSRRFLVVDHPTHADFAAYGFMRVLKAADFPTEFPERFELVWKWRAAMEQEIEKGLKPEPRVMRRTANWPN